MDAKLNKRAKLVVFLAVLIAVLIVIGWVIGPPRVDQEVMRTLASAFYGVVGAAVTAIIGISFTDHKEAHIEQVKATAAPAAPAMEPA